MADNYLPTRIDPRPVRPARLNLLDAAAIRVDGSRVMGPNPEDGPRIAATFTDLVAYRRAIAQDPNPPRDGHLDLRTPADFITNMDGTRVQWTRGFGYRPESCDGSARIDIFGTTEGTPPTQESEIDVRPFMVEGIDKVSDFGAATEEIQTERRDMAYRQLIACRSKQIEQELWHGTLSVAAGWGNRYLADSNVNLVEGDRLLGYITALAVLEEAINEATCSQQGMIHCRADTATLWASQYLVMRVGNLLVTALGTIVVPGAGYNGGAPAAGTPHLNPAHAGVVPGSDSAWAYATTVPEVFLSDLLPHQLLPERVTRASNDLTTYMRQTAAVTWGCLQAGVHVDHTSDITITGS